MANIYLAAQSRKPGSSIVVLIDNEPSTTAYRYMGFDLGKADWNKLYSGPRGTQGARLVGATAQNRLVAFQLHALGATHDALEAALSVLWQLDEEFRRFGGTVTWRPQGGSFLMYLEVLDSGVAADWAAANAQYLYHQQKRVPVSLGIVTPPYAPGPPMDIFDDFSVDTEANYTFDAGSGSDVAVSGGVLTASGNLSVEKRMIHTAIGYTYGDQQVTLKATPGSTITSYKAGVVLKRIDASNYLEVYVDDNGTNSRLRLDKVVAAARTNLSTTNLAARVVNATPFWVRGRIEDSTVYLEYFTAAPTPMSTPTLAASSALAGGDITLFGLNAVGRAGFSWVPQQAAAVLDDFAIDAFVRRNATLPQKFALNGVIPGDAPALATISVSVATPPQPLTWALLAWAERTGANAPFGVIEAETGSSLLNWASTADANYRGGTGLKFTTSGAVNLSALWVVDPTALVPDDYRRNEIDVEVWARVELASSLVSAKLTLQSNPVSSGLIDYTSEYGSAGKLLTVPSSGTGFRFVRLGTLRLSNATTYQIALAGRVEAGSSGQFGLDYLVLCLSRSRALGPTGKPRVGANYPSFLGDNNATKRVLSDLAGRFRSGASLADVPYSSMGGSLIEIPPGQVDLLVKPSQLVPDDPTSDTSSETLAYSCTVQLDDVTPRWRLARSS